MNTKRQTFRLKSLPYYTNLWYNIVYRKELSMTLSKGLQELLHAQGVTQVLAEDEIKAVMSAIKEYQIDITKLLAKVDDEGFAVIAEPLLIYNPEAKHIFLGINRPEGCQVLKKLCFKPSFYQQLLDTINVAGFHSTCMVETITGHHITFIFVCTDKERMREIKNSYERVYKGKRND